MPCYTSVTSQLRDEKIYEAYYEIFKQQCREYDSNVITFITALFVNLNGTDLTVTKRRFSQFCFIFILYHF